MKFIAQITGKNTMLMHSAALSDPLSPAAKEFKKISGKRSKTEDDHLEMARLEFLSSLYYDNDLGVYIPGENIFATLLGGAKKKKLGVKFKEAVIIDSPINVLVYDGPDDKNDLFEDKNFVNRSSVKVGQARIMRTRPQFASGWTTEFTGELQTDILDFDDLKEIAAIAGNQIGLGDWRPMHGRFEVNSFKKLSN